jgi:hypothetical protein
VNDGFPAEVLALTAAFPEYDEAGALMAVSNTVMQEFLLCRGEPFCAFCMSRFMWAMGASGDPAILQGRGPMVRNVGSTLYW